MKKILLIFILIVSAGSTLASDDSLKLFLRDKDISNFQKIRLFLNITDGKGEAVSNIDSSKIFIEESTTGKREIPRVEKFLNSNSSIALCFVIDASVSMSGAPLNNIKDGLLTILPSLRAQDKMGIAYFNDEFYKKTDFTSDKEILKNNIREITTGGSSSQIYPSIKLALEWLMTSSSTRKILVVLSDGDDNSNYKREEIEALVVDKPISLFTVGTIAATADSKNTLKNLEIISSKALDGFYYKIDTPEDMKNIIPVIYDRVKNEYVLTYYSYAPVSTEVKSKIIVDLGKGMNTLEYTYKSPETIVENAPARSVFESKEFFYILAGTGLALLILSSILVTNIRKKKQFKLEKEHEQKMREIESGENRIKFEQFQKEYEDLLDRLESQQNVSDEERAKIAQLEGFISETSKSAFGEPVKIDTRRRTMILEAGQSKSELKNANVPSLVLQSSQYQGQKILVNRSSIDIGRQECDVILNENTISRNHATIFFSNGEYFIRDNNSTNGTYLNNSKISIAKINSGDRIRLGNVEMIFKS